MRNAFTAIAVVIAWTASAGTISSIDHASIPVRGGEYFMTIYGTDLGNRVRYQGSIGTFELDVNFRDARGGKVIAWIPERVILASGVYSLTVLGGPSGDSGPISFTVYKPGAAKLSLHLPELIAIPAKSRAGVGIKYDVTVLGGEGTPTVKCDPESGSVFPFGNSLIRCIAYDLATEVSGEIAVTVWDAAPPTLVIPRSFEVMGDDEKGTYVKYDVSAADEIDGQLIPSCSPKSESLFVPGITRVRCEAVDASLNYAEGTFEVMVTPRDIGKLQLKVPAEVVAVAGEWGNAMVDFEVLAYGSADPDPVVECYPSSGSWFDVGEWKVGCVATDDFKQRAEASFLVVVKKEGEMMLEGVTAEATSPSGATVSFDDVDGWTSALSCSHASGSSFPLGTTSVRCESRADTGKLLAGTFDVIVEDTIAPHVAAVRVTSGATDAEQNVELQIEVDAIDAADAMPRCSVSGVEGLPARVTSDLALSMRSADATSKDFRLQVSCVDRSGNRASQTVPVRLGASRRRGVSR